MDRDLKVALVGYGMAGKVLHAPLIGAIPALVLDTVVSSDPSKVQADWPSAKVVATLDQALANPAIDLVVLATPDHLHAPQALASLAAGKHVVIDKPFAVSLSDARGIVQAAESSKGLLSVFQNRRWDGDYLTVRRLIENGDLGEVVEYHSSFNRFRPVARDLWKERREAGVWQDLGPHLIDQALILFGLPEAVYADIGVQKSGGSGGDYVHAVLRYPRLRVILHASQMTADPGPRFAVHGTGGSFIKHALDTQESGLKRGGVPGSPGWGAEESPGRLTPASGPEAGESKTVAGEAGNYLSYYAALREAIWGRGANPVTPDEALSTMRVLEAGRRSAAQRREIAMAEV